MKHYFFLIIITFLASACTNTPDAPVSKEKIAKEKIAYNKTEAQQAKEDYIKLQQQRKYQ